MLGAHKYSTRVEVIGSAAILVYIASEMITPVKSIIVREEPRLTNGRLLRENTQSAGVSEREHRYRGL